MQYINPTKNESLIISNPFENSDFIDIFRNYGWEMLHNPAIYSFVYGPVSVFDGLPYYNNGTHVLIVGYSLTASKISISSRIKLLAKKIINDYGKSLKTFEYWGATEPPAEIHSMLHCVDKIYPNDNNRDVILNLGKISSNLLYSYRFVRKAIQNHLLILINTKKVITSAHHNLVTKFISYHPWLDLDGYKYILNWEQVLRHNDSVLFEVFKKDILTGFIILSRFCDKMPTYAYGFFDNQVAGTSDLAHAAMINYCLRHNYPMLDLGYSINNNLLRYKLKWGPVDLINPPWSILWRNTLIDSNFASDELQYNKFDSCYNPNNEIYFKFIKKYLAKTICSKLN